jgi:CDP-diacylglycerol--serine O-phosphatidyltransferase
MTAQSYRGIFPGIFTMGNVVCGFVALLSMVEGKVIAACWLVILAAFLDSLDGKVARLSKTTSQFGVELDSLADFLSFAVAPGLIVYMIKLESLGTPGKLIVIVYIMAAAFRLARFNLMAETEEKKDFVGLPVPGAALALISFILFSYSVWGGLEYDELLVAMIVLFAFLMVSQIQYDSLPDRVGSSNDRIKMGIALVLLVVVAVVFMITVLKGKRASETLPLLLFPLFSLYILSGMVREGYRLFFLGVNKVTGRVQARREANGRNGDNDDQ